VSICWQKKTGGGAKRGHSDFNNDGSSRDDSSSDILGPTINGGQGVEWWISDAAVIGIASPASAASCRQTQGMNAD
jgi:hypothetical protein